MLSRATVIATVATLTGIVSAGHSVSVVNNCGYGTPMMNGPSTGLISVAGGYSTSGDMTGWIMFLQTGQCGNNGESCLIGQSPGRFSVFLWSLCSVPPFSGGHAERRLLQR